jgi:hypothetical protein
VAAIDRRVAIGPEPVLPAHTPGKPGKAQIAPEGVRSRTQTRGLRDGVPALADDAGTIAQSGVQVLAEAQEAGSSVPEGWSFAPTSKCTVIGH